MPPVQNTTTAFQCRFVDKAKITSQTFAGLVAVFGKHHKIGAQKTQVEQLAAAAELQNERVVLAQFFPGAAYNVPVERQHVLATLVEKVQDRLVETFVVANFQPTFAHPEFILRKVFTKRDNLGYDEVEVFVHVAQILGQVGTESLANVFEYLKLQGVSNFRCGKNRQIPDKQTRFFSSFAAELQH